jgi:hypothetical protein
MALLWSYSCAVLDAVSRGLGDGEATEEGTAADGAEIEGWEPVEEELVHIGKGLVAVSEGSHLYGRGEMVVAWISSSKYC